MLSGIYRYVNLVYVGGGFGKSIHNTQEPAIWGLPIVFGPKYEKFQEAVDMKNLNGAFAVFSKNEALKTIDELINNADLRQKASEINKNYMINKTGATSKVMSWCLKMNILSL